MYDCSFNIELSGSLSSEEKWLAPDNGFKVRLYYMSRQKCMSFSKCSNLKAKKVTCFKLCYQKDTGSNYDL